jgi:hypothetical protein
MRPEDIACVVEEPDWENSDASSDEDDDDYFQAGLPPLDPLQQAQSSTEPDEEPVDVPPTPREDYSADETNVARGTTVTSPSTSSTSSSTLPVTFDSPVGPAIDMPSTSTALDVFNLTFGNNIMEMLVEQTNLYAIYYLFCGPHSERCMLS